MVEITDFEHGDDARTVRGAGVSLPDGAGRRRLVSRVFDAAARRYDLMNDVLSGGIHRLWKSHLVASLALAPYAQTKIIDVAGGTGDIAFAIATKARGAQIAVIDINAAMLACGRARSGAYRKGGGRVGFIQGDAELLPLADGSCDIYVVGFGMRNFADRARALAEAYRVLRGGGRFFCLEFSHVAHPLFDRAYQNYSRHVIPRLGGTLAGARDAYQYLVDSIAQFPSTSDFADELRAIGLARVQYQNLSGGIAALHMGARL